MKTLNNLTIPKKEISQLLIVIFFSVCIYFLMRNTVDRVTTEPAVITDKCTDTMNLSENLVLAQNAIVYDIRTNCVLYAKNIEKRVPVASLTKLMTSIVATESLAGTTELTITEEDLEKPDSQGLRSGDIFTLDELIKLTLLTSSNDGAHAISRYINKNIGEDENTLTLMNKKAVDIGMTNTVFYNESGLDEGSEYGSLSTAKDMSILLSYIYTMKPELLDITSTNNLTISDRKGDALIYKNTNPYANTIPALSLSKTGYTYISGGALGIVFEKAPLHPIVIVVLGSTKEGRFVDTLALVNKVLEK